MDYGFRLPSALDNRPLKFEEFLRLAPQAVFVSATPGPYELEQSAQIVEQVVRPTGLVDPEVEFRPASDPGRRSTFRDQRARVGSNERVLVTTLTKRMAEDLTDYLCEHGMRVRYLHSDIDTVERVEIIRDLRLGALRCLGGINLLREGLGSPGGFIGRDPGCGQGRVFALGAIADSNRRPRGPQPRGQGHHVCQRGNRLDGTGAGGDGPPPH